MMVSPDVADALRRILLNDAARLVVAIVSMAIGLGSILVQWLRRKSQDRVRLWFGLLALLYGYRALLDTQSARFFLARSDVDFQTALITFTIGIPVILFGWELVAQKHNWFTKSLLTVNALMAVTFLLFHSSSRVVGALFVINNIQVITFTVAMIVYLYFIPANSIPELKTLRIIILVWGLFVIYSNLRRWLPQSGADVEFIGFAIFLCSLGYLVAQRSLRNEQSLLAIRKELEIARNIQSSILPDRMPSIAGLQIAAEYLPMTEVAGDFYDFLVVDDRRLGILIADVSGHGVPAALVASMVKIAIAAQAPHADDPAKVTSGLNSILSGKLQGQFVTAAYVFLDLESMTGRYCAAGHPPLLKYSPATNATESITENGLVLGVFSSAVYSSRSFRILAGDRFLLYTDGVLEASRNQEEFGEARLLECFRKSTGAEQLCDSVSSAVKDWAGGVAGDDITLVAMQFD